MSFLNIEGLEVVYSNGREVVNAVNSINIALDKKQTLGIVGETGAGKTTMALALMRLLPERTGKIVKGNISFNGIDIVNASEGEMEKIRGGRISMIFQDPMTSLNPVIQVGQQIKEALILHNDDNKSDKELDERTDEILKLVGITPKRKNGYPHEFSGGMKQRVVIAIALACSPELLIADEPTTALDVTIQAQVLAMMEELKQGTDMSMIMITHDLGIVARTCDIIAVMYAGEIIEQGTFEDFFAQNTHRHPYTQGLFGSIPNIEDDAERLTPIDGLMPDPTHLPTGCYFHPRCPHCTKKCIDEKPELYKADATHFIKCHSYNKEGKI